MVGKAVGVGELLGALCARVGLLIFVGVGVYLQASFGRERLGTLRARKELIGEALHFRSSPLRFTVFDVIISAA